MLFVSIEFTFCGYVVLFFSSRLPVFPSLQMVPCFAQHKLRTLPSLLPPPQHTHTHTHTQCHPRKSGRNLFLIPVILFKIDIFISFHSGQPQRRRKPNH